MKKNPVEASCTILLFGQDAGLVQTRKWILESEGYQTCIVPDFASFQQTALSQPVDLFLLCDSLSPEARTAALTLIHDRWPHAKLLVLASTRSATALHTVEPIFLSMEGPDKFVKTIRILMAAPPQASAPNLRG